MSDVAARSVPWSPETALERWRQGERHELAEADPTVFPAAWIWMTTPPGEQRVLCAELHYHEKTPCPPPPPRPKGRRRRVGAEIDRHRCHEKKACRALHGHPSDRATRAVTAARHHPGQTTLDQRSSST